MNDKIKLFNEQAIKYAQESLNDIAIVNKSGIMYNYNDLYTEKFAELIVRECADQIISKGTDWVDFAPSQTGVRPEYWNIAQQIKQHFGVEE